jgi:hypothetical protein
VPRPASAARRLAAAAALVALAAAPARGQLLKRVKQMAAERAAESLGRPAAEPAAEAPAARRAPLPITPARLDVFLTSMRPAVAFAERARVVFAARAAHDSASRRYEAARARRDACGERVIAQERPRLMRLATNPEALQRLNGYSPESARLLEDVTAAMGRGDVTRLQALQDSADVLRYKAQLGVIPALAACGAPVRAPAPPPDLGEGTPDALIVPPADMTAGQFGRLRERVALYALAGAAARGADFTPEERAALDARAPELARLAPLFRDGLLEWGHWGALGARWRAAAAAAPTP